MDIKDIRKRTGLSQSAFAQRYRIPLQTLKQWESSPESTSYRKPPEYVPHMLEILVEHDFNISLGALTRAENLIVAAKHSSGSLRQWLRYLGKEFDGQKLKMTADQINAILSSDEVNLIQKVVFKRVIDEGTATNEYAKSLGMRAKTPMVDTLIKGLQQ